MSDIFRSDDKRISPAIVIATACGIGFIPKAPGTFGSLPGLVLGALLHIGIANFFSSEIHNPLGGESIIILLISFAILSAIAYWSIKETERIWKNHDDKRIVSDEVIGQAIACVIFAPNFLNLFLSFLLFRIFDIWKPLAIGWVDKKVHGAWGTLLDDIIAGITSACIMGVIYAFI